MAPTKSPRASEDGFSVLEAIVAMAILAAALIPLLALQGQFLRTTQALERVEQRLGAEETALAHIGALNLVQSPTGTLSTQSGEISWQSRAVMPARKARNADGFPSRYNITLYEVTVTLSYKGGRQEQFLLQGLGWKPTKSLLKTL